MRKLSIVACSSIFTAKSARTETYNHRGLFAGVGRHRVLCQLSRFLPAVLVAVLLVLYPKPGLVYAAAADESTATEFAACLSNLKQQASSAGISQNTIESVFADVAMLSRVIKADRKQPEFASTFADYYNKRVTPYRMEKGRELRVEHAKLLNKVARDSGVPAQYLLAFWGLETNFGQYFGKLYIPSALTTLACDQRRADFFTAQLQAMLQIVEAGHMQPEQLVGSWAGALGHMQFMPTTFLAHAKDGDGDDKADLIGSLDDAMTSAGAYLRDIGWQPGFRWGREVVLPSQFDYSQTGRDNWQPLHKWAAAGVRDVFGKPLASVDMQAALLLPSGHRGPAFLVYENFEVIMKWNRSEFYALSVGRLADRIAGAGQLHKGIPDLKFSTTDLISVQEDLDLLGYNPGKADGILGSGTRRAIQAFQKVSQENFEQTPEQNLTITADGFPNSQLLVLLAAAVAKHNAPDGPSLNTSHQNSKESSE